MTPKYLREIMRTAKANVALFYINKRFRAMPLKGRRFLTMQSDYPGTLVGVYNLDCPKPWIEEDMSYAEEGMK